MGRKFYQTKEMKDFTTLEWEMICDGCGLCCLEKLIDEDTGKLYFTKVACRYLDLEVCRCRVYNSRFSKKSDCVNLTSDLIKNLDFLPSTCSYKILFTQKRLPYWHYLESGDKNLVHEIGISAKNFAISGENIHPDDLQYFI